MSYQNYVVAAYAIFVVAMLWDFIAPRLQIRQMLRAANLRAARSAIKPDSSSHRHPGASRDPS